MLLRDAAKVTRDRARRDPRVTITRVEFRSQTKKTWKESNNSSQASTTNRVDIQEYGVQTTPLSASHNSNFTTNAAEPIEKSMSELSLDMGSKGQITVQTNDTVVPASIQVSSQQRPSNQRV